MQRFQLLLWLCATLSFNALQAQCIQGNCFNGVGQINFPSGSTYQGDFKNGQFHGKGVFNYTDGRMYNGNFRNGQFHGKGTFQSVDKSIYKGDYQNGKREGDGVLTLANGDVYTGQWKADNLNGIAKYIASEGWTYTGAWYNDAPTQDAGICLVGGEKLKLGFDECRNIAGGKTHTAETAALKEYTAASFKFSDGSLWYGPVEDGFPIGTGKCEFPDGKVYEGEWKRTYPHGLGGLIYPDGRVSYGNWEAGVLKERLETPFAMVKQTMKKKAPLSKSETGKAKVWAIIVGVAQYSAMPSLKYSDDDAYLMYAFYKSPEGGALPDEQISLLIDEGASRTNIINALKEKAALADSGDVLVFYYSGHGLKDNLTAHDFDGSRNLVSYTEIYDILDKSSASQKVCYIDACYAGSLSMAKDVSGINRTVDLFYDALGKTRPGVALILSSKSTETSKENSGLRQGVFSYFLIQGLKGRADSNDDNIVSVYELFAYLQKEVSTYTQGMQNPVISGEYDATLPLAAIRQ